MMSRHRALFCSLFIVVGGIVLALTIFDPLWYLLGLHVPGELENRVDFTSPVDSIFYVRNASEGYQWSKDAPTSLWFHPLIPMGIRLLPSGIAPNIRYYVLSQLSAFLSLIFLYQYMKEVSPSTSRPYLLGLVPLLPGGLNIIAGNAEFPCLLFTTLLILSIIQGRSYYLTVLWGALAILTKPNALYMIPALAVYFGYFIKVGEHRKQISSLLGILSLGIVWLMWIAFVDYKVGQLGAYWSVREIASVPLSSGPFSFLQRTASVITYTQDYGEHLKFAMAIAIPLVDMWILLGTPFDFDEVHRVSIVACILAMVFVTFIINNPNKIIVYVTTFPGHFAAGSLFLRNSFGSINGQESALSRVIRYGAGFGYIVFCLLTGVFFLIGTPLGWYY